MSNILAGSFDVASYQVLESAIMAFDRDAAMLLSLHTDTSPSTLEMLMREALSKYYRDVLYLARTPHGLDKIDKVISSSNSNIILSYGVSSRIQTMEKLKRVEAMGAEIHAQFFHKDCIGVIDYDLLASSASRSVQCTVTYVATAILFSVMRRYQQHIGTTKRQLMCILQVPASARWPAESDEITRQGTGQQSMGLLQDVEHAAKKAIARPLWTRLRLRHQRLNCVVAVALGIVVVFSVMRAQQWINY
ncbi:hypothetical protein [Burkholderia vietnamiensis]|uniref:hypothetical protein n=1 Tax=Burkholderia vietnamiensis TaxID=60552 RepID=UPI000B15E139|nr:hypothetical protein [Burkholderia vietnamiensis]HDR9090151.1 hypothetical protein [Burkholderia vietnamiensis]